MLENIQQTALVFSLITYLVIALTKSSDLNAWLMGATLAMFFGSIATLFVTTLMRIWA